MSDNNNNKKSVSEIADNCCSETNASEESTTATVSTAATASTTPAAQKNNANQSMDQVEALMAQLEMEAAAIEEDEQANEQDLQDRSLRMLTPEQVEANKQQQKAATMTKAERRAALRKKIRSMQADRSSMSTDQFPVDARGKRIRSKVRMTQAQIRKARSGQLGLSSNSGGGGAKQQFDPENLTEEQMARITEMMQKNPQLLPD